MQRITLDTTVSLTGTGRLGVALTLLGPVVTLWVYMGLTNAMIQNAANRYTYDDQPLTGWLITLAITGVASICGPIMIFLGRTFSHRGVLEDGPIR